MHRVFLLQQSYSTGIREEHQRTISGHHTTKLNLGIQLANHNVGNSLFQQQELEYKQPDTTHTTCSDDYLEFSSRFGSLESHCLAAILLLHI